ncbi:MAG: STAS domain-containing protein [Actinomycetota bacterium]|nr:STAS domain-containing protein [Actinomycetota bacterium]
MGRRVQRRHLAEVGATRGAVAGHPDRAARQSWDGFGLTITVSRIEGERADLYAAGDLDMASAGVLAACLENQLACNHRFVRLDLSRLAFLDSAGVSAILKAHDCFMADCGTLILTGVGARHARLIEIVGLDSVLLIAAPTPVTALTSASA